MHIMDSIFCSKLDSDNSKDIETDIEEHVTVEKFVDTIDAYGDKDFKTHMRLRRDTVDFLICKYTKCIVFLKSTNYFSIAAIYSESEFAQTTQTGGRTPVGSKKAVYMYLWYVANTLTFRQVANLFGCSKSGAWNSIDRCTKFLISVAHIYIKWPEGPVAEQTLR